MSFLYIIRNLNVKVGSFSAWNAALTWFLHSFELLFFLWLVTFPECVFHLSSIPLPVLLWIFTAGRPTPTGTDQLYGIEKIISPTVFSPAIVRHSLPDSVQYQLYLAADSPLQSHRTAHSHGHPEKRPVSLQVSMLCVYLHCFLLPTSLLFSPHIQRIIFTKLEFFSVGKINALKFGDIITS